MKLIKNGLTIFTNPKSQHKKNDSTGTKIAVNFYIFKLFDEFFQKPNSPILNENNIFYYNHFIHGVYRKRKLSNSAWKNK